MYRIIFSLLLVFIFGIINAKENIIDLSGYWKFSIDNKDIGEKEQWFNVQFKDSVKLPGTTDTNQKGTQNTNWQLNHLSRKFIYIGKAWYQKEVVIPTSWNGKDIELFIERTKSTKVWINNKYIGANKALSVPQKFNVTKFFSAGNNTITILVDNSLTEYPARNNPHALAEHTQTNWNGMIGKLNLKALNKSRLKFIDGQLDRTGNVFKLRFLSDSFIHNANIACKATGINSNKHEIKKQNFKLKSIEKNDTIVLSYQLTKNYKLWSHIEPNLYRFDFEIDLDGHKQSLNENIGLRTVELINNHFYVNGNKTFIISKHDACIFPLTGYPPMTKEEWIRQMKISKEYGFNSYRFHSWTPPKACFEAADIVGIYLQPEIPAWYRSNSTGIKDDAYFFLLNEGIASFEEYGQHASFIKFTLGNENSGNRKFWSNMILSLKELNRSIFIAAGSNNFFADPKVDPNEDYFVTAKVGPYKPNFESDIRASFAFVDDPNGGGVLNRMSPNSIFTFSKALADFKLPVLSHETGQYQVFPNYDEIPKYTGVLEPRNLKAFSYKLMESGMYNYWKELYQASGHLATLCYRADNEIMLRTPELAGFQILDIQDFTGQGTALVGILDAFMDSKGFITPDEWRQSCADLTIQANMEKFVWLNTDMFKSDITIINYSHSRFSDKVSWQVYDDENNIIGEGAIEEVNIENGIVKNVGQILLDLSSIKQSKQLNLVLNARNSKLRNEYKLWVYVKPPTLINNNIHIVNRIDENFSKLLAQDSKILLIPDSTTTKGNSIGGLFTSDYWCYPMFMPLSANRNLPVSPGTLGLLIDDNHKTFNHFPTGKYTDWNWYSVIKNSRPIFLNKTPESYRPIVHVVDNFDRCSKLGMMFEMKVGKASVFVCSVNFDNLNDVVRETLLYTIKEYVGSEQFMPKSIFSIEDFYSIFNAKYSYGAMRQTNNSENTEQYLQN